MSECSFDIGSLDIVVSVDLSGAEPLLAVSQDINMGEYRILLATVGDGAPLFSWEKPSRFAATVDGVQEFMEWAGALCHVGNATIDQTVGFFNRLNLLLKLDVGIRKVRT